MQPVTEQEFEAALKHRLGPSWERAIQLFRVFGPSVSRVYVLMLEQACAARQLEQVLSVLEGFCESHRSSPPNVPATYALDERLVKQTFALIIQETFNMRDPFHTLELARLQDA